MGWVLFLTAIGTVTIGSVGYLVGIEPSFSYGMAALVSFLSVCTDEYAD